MRAEMIALDEGAALRVDAPDGGCSLVIEGRGMHAVATLDAATVARLRDRRRTPRRAIREADAGAGREVDRGS